MTESLTITCPHCSAPFKAKSKSAFGKRVKCPKCDESFVIQKPSKHKASQSQGRRKKVKSDLDLFEDDINSLTYTFEEALSDGPALKPVTKKKKQEVVPKKKFILNRPIPFFESIKKYGFSPFIVVTGFSLLSLFTFFLVTRNSIGLAFTFIPLAFIASGCLLAGLISALFIAVKESFLELLLCLLVPFYIIYYLYSRIETTKHAYATTICGFIYYLGPFGLIYASYTINGYLPWGMVPRHNNPVIQARPKEIRNQPQPSAPNPVPEFKFSNLEGMNKFDLSQITPLLMSWPSGERPELGNNFYIEKNTNSIGQVFEVFNTRRYRGKSPAGGRMKFRVYLPPNLDPASPVPCVLIPPAGSNLLTGMEIDPPNLIPNPEHEPYLKAGFAVVTFSLDGPLLKRENASNHEFKLAHEAFRKSKAGLVNCVHAFLETQAVIPGVDKDNVFIAGHSSAGTLSLLFAEHFPQVKGCLAYAPEVDLEKSMVEYLTEFKSLVPDVENFIILSSPQTHISNLTCPVFLFHSRGDQVTSFTNSEKFASQLNKQGTEVEFVASDGNDHYQTMIDEGIPQGIEWIKKHLSKPKQSQPDPRMVASAVPSVAKNKKTNQNPLKLSKSLIDVTRRKAIFKVDRFNSTYEKKIKRNPEFWSKAILNSIQINLEELVPGLSKGTEKLDLDNMTLSFEYVGVLPSDIPQLLAGSSFNQPIKLAFQEPSIETVVNNPNDRMMASNHLTFRIFSVHGFRFNKKDSTNIAEAHLKQIDRYIPGSLIINFENKWIYIKLKGLGNKFKVEQDARNAFFKAGIVVRSEKINLSPADLATYSASTPTNTAPGKSSTEKTSTNDPQSNKKQKYVIHYGVYSGKSFKESVKRSLKGFVWVDQKSIQFNPDAKEISFINRSPVDDGALERALTRNKFYQLNITKEVVPEVESPPKKEETKAGT